MNAQRQILLGASLGRNQSETSQYELLVRLAELDIQIAIDATAAGVAAKLVFPEVFASQPGLSSDQGINEKQEAPQAPY